MNKSEVVTMKNLISYLNSLRNEYYNNNNSIISDKEYDSLFDKLQNLEKSTGVVLSNSPTQTVGYEVKSKLNKVKHSHPMLSLAKTKDYNELIKFANNQDCILSGKLDGLTVLLTYNNGKLIKAETRGDGYVGEDITHNAKVFSNIPLTIPTNDYIEIEGEAIITYEDFEKINSSLPDDKKYKNPRNLVSGSVRQLNNIVCKNRNVKFIVWKLPKYSKYFLDNFNYAKELGFEVVPFLSYSSNDKDLILQMIESLKNEHRLKQYPIDGLVMTYNDTEYGNSLGMTGHHPRHSIAFKFYNEEIETKLLYIDWTMGKTGVLTPTAVFEPIEIDGTLVERASLHNVSILSELKLKAGDIVTVYKANEIIPQIKENLSAKNRKENFADIISFCPICKSQTKINRCNNTDVLVCTNEDCKGKTLGKFSHFVSKNAMNIEGLSESTLDKFIKEGFISNNFIDIYKLKNYYDKIIKLDGFGLKSTDKLLKSIEDSKVTTLDRFIYSLCIPLVGRETAKIISNYCENDIKIFLDKVYNNFSWNCIEGIGCIVDNNIKVYSLKNYDNIIELSNCFTFVKNKFNENNNIKNKTFVITGTLNIFSNRDEIKEKIESLGGKVSGSVSKNTNYLINNDIDSMSSKNKKAKELNIPIITEQELIDLINI